MGAHADTAKQTVRDQPQVAATGQSTPTTVTEKDSTNDDSQPGSATPADQPKSPSL